MVLLMLSFNINAACVGISREQVQEYAELLPWLTKVKLGTNTLTQVVTDEMMTQPDVNNSWDEIAAEWYESGTEFMIF